MSKVISKTTTSVFVWVICILALLACGAIFLVLRQETSLPEVVMLLAFVTLGFVSLTIVSHLVSTPVCSASIDSNGDLTFSWRYLTKRTQKVFPATSLAEPTLVERIDNDGDSHWSAQLELPDGSVFQIADFGSLTGAGKNEKNRQRCEAKRMQFVEGLTRH